MMIRDLHRRAMACADEAFLAEMNNEVERARELWRRAFELEREAALAVEAGKQAEPTRSILLRSAASLALDCGELREAERLIAAALAGNPPDVETAVILIVCQLPAIPPVFAYV
jgi:hypothetical protein